MIDYPAYKKAFIEGMRVFIAAFISQLALLWILPEIKNVLLSDLSVASKCLIPFNHVCLLGASIWSDSWILLIVPCGTAAFKIVLKWSREKFAVNREGEPDYNHFLFKIPL